MQSAATIDQPSSLSETPPLGDSLVVRTLTAMARQRHGLNEARCRAMLEFMEAGTALHMIVRNHLAREGLSAAKFDLLLALYAIDPVPASPSDLAVHTGLCRPVVSDAIAGLVHDRLLVNRRDTVDRRCAYIHLTEAGRAKIDAVGERHLRLLGRIARLISTRPDAHLRRCCRLLKEGVRQALP